MKFAPTSLLSLLLLPLLAFGQAQQTRPQHSPGAAIASAHSLATDAGFQVLAQGGNAFDAAVTVSAVLSVVEPISSGLGGGGFFLLHDAKTGKDVFVDARETAPAAATPQAYLDKDGNLDRERSENGPWAAGIPGLPAALVHVAEKYGRLPLSQTLAPAIRIARAKAGLDPVQAVARGEYERGILVDTTGIASAIVANKVFGIRATPCADLTTLKSSREHNDANVLCLGAGLVHADQAREFLGVWLSTPFAGGRHARRVDKICQVEEMTMKRTGVHSVRG